MQGMVLSHDMPVSQVTESEHDPQHPLTEAWWSGSPRVSTALSTCHTFMLSAYDGFTLSLPTISAEASLHPHKSARLKLPGIRHTQEEQSVYFAFETHIVNKNQGKLFDFVIQEGEESQGHT